METRKSIAVDQVLVFSPSDMDERLVDAYLTTMVFANAAARSASGALQSPEACTAFYLKWSSTLASLGWTLTSGGESQIASRSLAKKTTTLAAEISKTVEPNTAEILASLERGHQLSPDAESFLKFWWDKVKTDATFACLTLGMLNQDTSGEERRPKYDLTVLFIDMSKITRPKPSLLAPAPKFEANTWQSLFVAVNANLDLPPTKSITGVLDLQVYGQQEAQIKAMLQNKAPEHYRLAALS